MRYGTWNVKRVYRAGSHTAADRELDRYKLDLVVSMGLGGKRGHNKSSGL